MKLPQDSEDEMLQALSQLAGAIDQQKLVVEYQASVDGFNKPQEYRLKDGSWPYLTVLSAQASVLNTIAMMTRE